MDIELEQKKSVKTRKLSNIINLLDIPLPQ